MGLDQLDVTRLAPKLYQGSAPPLGSALAHAGFQVVILCAREYQPATEAFPGVIVVRAHLDDSRAPISDAEWVGALRASDLAARAIVSGQRVLSTCYMGLNRSGLVSALTLHRLTGMSGADAITHVRAHRENALRNTSFVARLRQIAPRRVPAVRVATR